MPNQMNSLNNDEDLLILFYNSQTKNHKEILAYVESADTKNHAVDISKTKVTGTIWAEIADLMNIPVENLIDRSHSAFENRYGKEASVNADDTIKILQNDADMLMYPIAIKGKNIAFIKSYNEVLKFHESDTIGIEKTPIGNQNKY